MGDARTRRQTHRPAPVDNPVIAANRKAKGLKSLLAVQQPMRRTRVPWTEGAVFVSYSNLEINLAPEGRHHGYGRHDQNELPTILEHSASRGWSMPRLPVPNQALHKGESASPNGPRTVGSLRLV